MLAALCAAEKEPGLPIGLYIVGMPLLALGLGKLVLGPLGHFSETATLRLLAANFITTSLVAFGSFGLGQTSASLRWEQESQARWLAQVGCSLHHIRLQPPPHRVAASTT